jgi:hypothetical protein
MAAATAAEAAVAEAAAAEAALRDRGDARTEELNALRGTCEQLKGQLHAAKAEVALRDKHLAEVRTATRTATRVAAACSMYDV